MAGVTVTFEELESEVAATAAVAASRRTNTRNNFFGIHSVLPLRPIRTVLSENSNHWSLATAGKFLSSGGGFPVLEQCFS